jgi:hypothetical protein
MPRRYLKPTTTLEERLSYQARIARQDVEKLPPGKARDGLIRKLREIESVVNFTPLLRAAVTVAGKAAADGQADIKGPRFAVDRRIRDRQKRHSQ